MAASDEQQVAQSTAEDANLKEPHEAATAPDVVVRIVSDTGNHLSRDALTNGDVEMSETELEGTSGGGVDGNWAVIANPTFDRLDIKLYDLDE